MRKIIISALIAVSAAGAAGATTYSAAGDFSLTNSSAWAYGTGVGGTSFNAFSNTTTSCYGQSFSCYYSSDYQGAGVGSGGAFGTVTLDPTALWLHPADGGANPDTIVQFTAATTGLYSLTGFFERLSNVEAGNGVNVAVYHNAVSIFGSNVLGSGSLAYGTSASFGSTVSLAAGDTLSFVVNNNGTYGYDSTGLSAQIASVPEPASWAMMLGGFGVVGGALRSRKRAQVRFA